MRGRDAVVAVPPAQRAQRRRHGLEVPQALRAARNGALTLPFAHARGPRVCDGQGSGGVARAGGWVVGAGLDDAADGVEGAVGDLGGGGVGFQSGPPPW